MGLNVTFVIQVLNDKQIDPMNLQLSRSTTKPAKWPMRPAKTQTGQSIRCLHEEALGP